MNEERVSPACPIAKQCGGCQLQHMSYKEQLAFKKQKVQDVIERIAKLDVQVEDVLGMAQPDHYRNKGQIPVGVVKGQVVTGFIVLIPIRSLIRITVAFKVKRSMRCYRRCEVCLKSMEMPVYSVIC